jgi:hypothetical protein
MRQGAPDHVTNQPRLVGEVQPCDDARICAELCAHHLRVEIAADWCDDACWSFEHRESLYSLEQVIAWCRTLATGEDHTTREEAWGRIYQSTFSLDSHVGSEEQDPARRSVWFYPMTEARLCLGLKVGPSISALRACFTWGRDHLDVVEPEAREAIADGIDTCLALLDEADRRLGRASGRLTVASRHDPSHHS